MPRFEKLRGVMGQAIRGADGAIVSINGTISDITDVKRMETESAESPRSSRR